MNQTSSQFDYVAMILAAGATTLALSLCALVLAVLLGLAGAFAKRSRHRALSHLANAYATLVRGVPELVLLLLFYYGLPIVLGGFDFSPFKAGVLTLGFIYGAYFSETFRSALAAVPVGQLEAAAAIGMSKPLIAVRIHLPQMVRHAIPGAVNVWLVLVKATALVSVLGLEDVMFRARATAEASGEPLIYFLVAAGFFLAITTLSLALVRVIERRYSRGFKAVTI